MRALQILAAAACLAAAHGVRAGPSVTLNGVNVDGATDQRIENATVVFDAQGNIHILAKGYSVATSDSPDAARAASPESPAGAPPAAPAPALGRRYFVLGEQSEQDATGYDVSVFINGRWVKELRSADDPRQAFEVTQFLVPGANKVTLVASKRDRTRRGGSRDATFRVVMGEATVDGGQVAVERPTVDMQRSGAETETFTQDYAVTAR